MIPKNLLNALGSKGAADILDQLASGPRRPTHLAKSSGVSEPTAFSRLKILKKNGIIADCIIEEGERSYKAYKLTETAQRILKSLPGGAR